ncbi:MAG: GGDEF domain-containing protein [Hydrogenophilales bacterium CG_4_8_14_3_um_filter_62_83]|nr:MAG: GGDEF domain-containing protein [Hydrogenophilales bacterium CG_4_8_14_3_um_filter_62_83]
MKPGLWARLPLVGRVMLSASLALAVAGSLLLLVSTTKEADFSHHEIEEHLVIEQDSLLAAIAESAVIGDYASIEQVIRRRVKRDDIRRIAWTNARGKQLAASDKDAAPSAPGWFARFTSVPSPQQSRSLVIGSRDYGLVTIEMTATSAINRLWNAFLAHLAILSLALVLDFIGIWLILRSGLRPLRALNQAAESMARGDWSVHVEAAGSRELRNTIDVFNRMAQSIEAARKALMVEKERLQVTLSSIGDAVMATDCEGRVEFINPAAETLTGWTAAEAEGRSVRDVFSIIHETTREKVKCPVGRAIREGVVVGLANHTLLIARDGTERPIADSAAPIRHDDGRIVGAVLVFRDQTQERRTLDRLRLAARVFEYAPSGVAITDPWQRIVEINPAFTRLTGYSREEILGQTPRLLSSGRQEAGFYAAMWAAIRATGQWRGEIWNRHKNGEFYPVELAIVAMKDEVGQVSHYIGIFRDISQIKEQQQRLERIAHYDALTQLPNRVLLADRMHMALAQAQRVNGVLAVCYMDLDGFKQVNDELGHEAGDNLLMALSNRVTLALRAGDTVARLGGDEFVLLLGRANIDECRKTLDRLLKAIAEPYPLHNQAVRITASIGVSLFPQDEADPDTLLRHADQAMYTAKESGRNRYHLFDPERDRRTRAHHEAVTRIEQGLRAGEFVLYYQPKVDLRQGKAIGAEALIRWNHPLRGLLPPAEFLPFVEGHEFSIQLGDWVIEQALAQMAAWRAAGIELPVSVNVSARQMQRTDMAEQLAAALARHPEVPPQDLELEILETSALDDILHVTELIESCQRLGVRFALDDFGTGYSSLTYFKHLPAETLKIDQSFVRDMLHDTEDLAIVGGIVGLANAFQRQIVAEGVETVAHGTLLLHLGCDRAQGYAIARPMPASAMPDWIAAWQPDPRWAEACQYPSPPRELPLLVAEFNYQDWIDRVTDRLLRDTGPAATEPEQHASLFGRWLEGAARERYGELEAYKATRAIWRRLVTLANDLLALKQTGQADEARQRLAELDTLNQELLDQLRLFHQARSNDKRRPAVNSRPEQPGT